LVNFAYAAYKKTRDLALEVADAFYGNKPERLYYFGGSEGGREGLTMAQRFPNDYDGIVSIVPVINWAALQSAGNRTGIVQQNGG
jgi:feruloyl esterase